MENTIDNADNFLLERNDIIGEPSYPERVFWAELLVEYGKLLQSDVGITERKFCPFCKVEVSRMWISCSNCDAHLMPD